MACGAIHLHRHNIAPPESHKQLHEHGGSLVGDEVQARGLTPLPQQMLDTWLVFWCHQDMHGTLVCTQQPASKLPVA
jgi:hypothetical protein